MTRSARSAYLTVASVIAMIVVVATTRTAAAQPAADTVRVGVYTPTIPFSGPVARLEYASNLASHIGAALGVEGVGRAYATASDFQTAVRRGDLELAVVDAAYLAAVRPNYRVLAAATRGGDRSISWQVVTSSDADNILGLQGKSIAIPRIGARNQQFFSQVLLGDELTRFHFSAYVVAPDPLSAIASVVHGRAVAAAVPVGVKLPSGVRAVGRLASVPLPMLVALPNADPERVKAAVAAIGSFRGELIERFVVSDDRAVRALTRRFSPRRRRGVMVKLPATLDTDGLFRERQFAVEPGDPTRWAQVE